MKPMITLLTIFLIGCSGTRIDKQYTQEEIDYFVEIALGAEFGDIVPVIKKWEEDVRIKINGIPTEEDLLAVNSVVNDLNELVEDVRIKVVNRDENITITFSPESEFSDIDANYVPTNYGFFWALWHDDNYVIYNASILIASAAITQPERSHLIREELTQSLGLMNDSEKYEDSIFYQKWTNINNFSNLDKAVISLLYQKNIRAGMSRKQLLDILN
jgi:hypothetical protein